MYNDCYLFLIINIIDTKLSMSVPLDAIISSSYIIVRIPNYATKM